MNARQAAHAVARGLLCALAVVATMLACAWWAFLFWWWAQHCPP